MAQTQNRGAPGQPPKEMSMETRLLLAFLLMGAVMFLTNHFVKPQPPAPNKQVETPAPAPVTQTAPAAAPEASAAPASKAKAAVKKRNPATPVTLQNPLPPFVIDTDLYRIEFSNQGANMRSWLLKKHRGSDGKPLELINTASGLDYPFALRLPGEEALQKTVNWAYYAQTPEPGGLGVVYAFTDGSVSVRKVFRFQKDSYLSEVATQVSVEGKPLPAMIQWRGGFGDFTVPNPTATQETLYFNVAENSLTKQTARNAKNGPLTSQGVYSFAGIEDKYFAAAFLPEGDAATQETTFCDTVPAPLEKTPAVFPGMAISGGEENRFSLFVGPKDLDLMKRINPKLEQLVDFGKWLGFLAKPLFLITNWFNKAYVHNFGWSIVVVTIALNMALFPIKLSNMKSMRKMQALKPEIDKINARYKNVGMRDPKKAEQNQEVMALYKQNGVNPMGGCFPMLMQIPFFFAFYKVFTVSVEMRGASWLWVGDLSQPETLPIHILPVVMVASQFVMQKMTPQAPAQDPGQQKMMMFMPLIFGFMFYHFASGLVLYYLTSNLVSMGQQWFFNHTAAAEEAARSVEIPKRRSGKKQK
jgi:YidC/Oxa1 family membrane protein insertase